MTEIFLFVISIEGRRPEWRDLACVKARSLDFAAFRSG